jgi:hypothetical protein
MESDSEGMDHCDCTFCPATGETPPAFRIDLALAPADPILHQGAATPAIVVHILSPPERSSWPPTKRAGGLHLKVKQQILLMSWVV